NPLSIDSVAEGSTEFPFGEQGVIQVGNEDVDGWQFVLDHADVALRAESFDVPWRNAVEDIDIAISQRRDSFVVARLRLLADRAGAARVRGGKDDLLRAGVGDAISGADGGCGCWEL